MVKQLVFGKIELNELTKEYIFSTNNGSTIIFKKSEFTSGNNKICFPILRVSRIEANVSLLFLHRNFSSFFVKGLLKLEKDDVRAGE